MALRSFNLFRRSVARHNKIVYTITDEAPALATHALLPVVSRFTSTCGVSVEPADISVAARILSQFPDYLSADQQVPDTLASLGHLAKSGEARIIKLPNVSASIPQLVSAVEELQKKGFAIPDFPTHPKTDQERDVARRYARVLGSAVNPVLREGNSDRRVAAPVKKYAQAHPVRLKQWRDGAKSRVAHMNDGDFYANERSMAFPFATTLCVEHVNAAGEVKVLRSEVPVTPGEVVDVSRLDVAALRAFYSDAIEQAKKDGVLFSLHLKATMMKVSDPIMFGHCVSVFLKDVFEKYETALRGVSANPNNGLASVIEAVKTKVPQPLRDEILEAIDASLKAGPPLAMVDSSRGITNLHVPSDVIIDASMPNVMRDGGCMWNAEDALQETMCTIPDRCYAGIYQAMIEDIKENGQFDPTTMGNVANVGLMAQKAEEYGSHDKTFEIPSDGVVRVRDLAHDNTVWEMPVKAGDIWRACQTKDAPIRDWVRLAVERARLTGLKTIFWLTPERAHDRVLIDKVRGYLKEHDLTGLDIDVMTPENAMKESCTRARQGLDTISVTGNVLRDYLTDLFPILELGTSAKMLSIVPMLAGGAMYETGAGGSAPKHVWQFVKENHLRWDSLGEYLAIAVALEDLGVQTKDPKAQALGESLQEAVSLMLTNRKSPSRKVREMDNRGTTFWLTLYWAQAMAQRDPQFQALADELEANKDRIHEDFIECQGAPVDTDGYWRPNEELTRRAMRPSEVFNKIIDAAPAK
eukprot:TRINITY_DN470_c0_g3_i1.p1 TRINITY_DN470_c0_g3~~TRINITY_DN470_c0_g3_i1.p1  ORF type:complete len:753 (-),score=232.34 TRINITY_DN470_c0_g3_i1:351-2609(-)